MLPSGFRLKPCGYKTSDWTWLFDNFKGRVHKWSHRWLSLGVRYIIVQAELQQLVVYWAQLSYLLAHTISLINVAISQFLWTGASKAKRYHLCKHDNISVPKEYEGCGLLNVRSFSNALLIKS